ncbi:MFS-type transporter SLC18B1-like protein, partial [Leptotrombidium deliense]
PTLSTHLFNNSIETEYSGIAFFVISTAYAVSSLAVGFWAAKTDKFLLTFVGLIFTAVGFAFIGPSNFIPLNTSFWLTCVAMAVIGISTSIAITPSFEVMLLHITDKGYSNDVNTYGLISGLWSSMWSLGDITGPAIGGLLAQHLGFPNAATIITALTAATAVSVVINFCCSKGNAEEESLIDKTSDESKSDKRGRLAMSERHQTFEFENHINQWKKEMNTQKSYGTSI